MTIARIAISRRAFVAGGAALAISSTVAGAFDRPWKVLFVCEHGSVKSPIAREHFRRIAARRGLSAVAQSRGIHPLEDVSPALATALAADGIDPRREPLTALIRSDLESADIVVTFNPIPLELTSGLAIPPREWFDVPGMNDDYAAARAVLLDHLEKLADWLDANALN